MRAAERCVCIPCCCFRLPLSVAVCLLALLNLLASVSVLFGLVYHEVAGFPDGLPVMMSSWGLVLGPIQLVMALFALAAGVLGLAAVRSRSFALALSNYKMWVALFVCQLLMVLAGAGILLLRYDEFADEYKDRLRKTLKERGQPFSEDQLDRIITFSLVWEGIFYAVLLSFSLYLVYINWSFAKTLHTQQQQQRRGETEGMVVREGDRRQVWIEEGRVGTVIHTSVQYAAHTHAHPGSVSAQADRDRVALVADTQSQQTLVLRDPLPPPYSHASPYYTTQEPSGAAPQPPYQYEFPPSHCSPQFVAGEGEDKEKVRSAGRQVTSQTAATETAEEEMERRDGHTHTHPSLFASGRHPTDPLPLHPHAPPPPSMESPSHTQSPREFPPPPSHGSSVDPAQAGMQPL
uniref:Uncharacterized protein n=1 Tax=Chromera velia CCMP2878 TaxID=1169474 RepID=A0A0G4HKD0_9ALVE|eukprot:Cvel_28385.t1-p1 / transcript=Cvel_28385.t1 / gene=Cvel_28385 / organism=Chromera_velia_CCMP2878 / gene_product=hypothetical protein / transcript_product=hypothetical protein / location=Cvel_scaffold3705:12215-13426(-) / protein_length=404 / sequence_SO=supercontig / SO=protein_coding / is_pseudo=false